MAGLSGKILGGFRILEQIQAEETAQGIVCKAICESETSDIAVSKGQIVALKVMLVRDDNQRQQWCRLENRTRELVQLRHPNIVRYYGCFSEQGEWNQLHVIVQEFLEGETLKERLVRFPSGLDVDEGLKVIDSALCGLAHTASKGIIHRDIKPGNIFICEKVKNGRKELSVKLIDFEIARQGHGSTTASTGNLWGSFNYMAPEFLDAKFKGDLLSDVFSMGVTLHETLTGKLPYERVSGEEDAVLDFVSRWRGLSEGKNSIVIKSDINRLLAHTDKLLHGCLSTARDERFGSFEAFREAVKSVRFRTLSNPASGNAYQMLQFIGRGGFGEVFKARETKTGRIVAIKHLVKAKYADRFKREAKILSKFDDDCFVRFVESFSRELDGRVQEFLVMGFLDGMPGNSLSDAIRRSDGAGLPIKDVFTAFIRYAHGLRTLHAAGVFHRDIKPSNLYFPAGRPDLAAIMDLGIARDTKGTLTLGNIPGTPDYMPPEVVTSGSRGESGMDVYALGLCMYEALTAKTAFAPLPPDVEGFKRLVERINSKVQPRFDDGRIDADVFDLLTDMTAFNPAYRIKDTEEVERRLREFLAKTGALDADPVPAPQQSVIRWRKHLAKWTMWGAAFTVGGVLLAGLLTVVGPLAKRFYAQRKLAAVLAAYRGFSQDAADRENAWVVEFNPQSYSWLRLDAESFAKGTNAIVAVRQKARADRIKGDWLARIGGCLTRDGGLEIGAFEKLKAWNWPPELDDEDDVRAKLSELGVAVRGRLSDCIDIGDIRDRRKRLELAEGILENAWTLKVLDADEASRMRKAVARAAGLCIGSVHNGCGGEIEVGDEKIAVNETRMVTVSDGRPERLLVTRRGYKPIPLPTGFDGMVFKVDDSSFVVKPIRFSVPKLAPGQRFLLQGHEYEGGERLELEPGRYIGRYVRGDKSPAGDLMYKDYLVEFSVTANAEVKIPKPGNWEYTDQYENYLVAPVAVTVPKLDADARCRIDGVVATVRHCRLAPGKHVCVYEKDDCLAQTNDIEVIPGKDVQLPGPAEWTAVESVRRLREAEKMAEGKLWSSVEKSLPGILVVSEKNLKALERLRQGVAAWKADERRKLEAAKIAAAKKLAAERASLLEKMGRLLDVEPEKGRRKRLELARKLLAGEVAQRLLKPDEIERWRVDVQDATHRVIGRIGNRCDFPFAVNGLVVAPGESRVVEFDDRRDDGVVVAAKGYEDIHVARELDESELVIYSHRWTMRDVKVRIAAGVEKDIVCVFEGKPVDGEFMVKPGRHALSFRRDGYESITAEFVAELGEGCVVEPPRDWQPLPVEVSIPALETGVECFLGASEVSKSVRLKPGRSYELRYRKADCVDQVVKISVKVGVPTSLPAPQAWVAVKDVEMLSEAERLASEGKWEEAAVLVKGVRLRAAANLERLRVLEGGIKRAYALKGSVRSAQESYLQEDWHECLRYYYLACSNGYSPNAGESDRIELAYRKDSEVLMAMLKKSRHDIEVGRTPIRLPEAIEKDLRQLNEWHAQILRLR